MLNKKIVYIAIQKYALLSLIRYTFSQIMRIVIRHLGNCQQIWKTASQVNFMTSVPMWIETSRPRKRIISFQNSKEATEEIIVLFLNHCPDVKYLLVSQIFEILAYSLSQTIISQVVCPFKPQYLGVEATCYLFNHHSHQKK